MAAIDAYRGQLDHVIVIMSYGATIKDVDL